MFESMLLDTHIDEDSRELNALVEDRKNTDPLRLSISDSQHDEIVYIPRYPQAPRAHATTKRPACSPEDARKRIVSLLGSASG